LGSVVEGQEGAATELGLSNVAEAPADSLAGSLTTAAPGFTVAGFGSFAGLAAGDTLDGLSIGIDSSTAGVVSGQITLQSQSTNPQPFSMDLPAITILLTGRVRLVGDYNGNDVVDAGDYTVWRNTLHQPVAAGDGADGNFDGQITSQDFTVWKNNFGRTLLGGGERQGGEVPEPAAHVLLLIGVVILVWRSAGWRERSAQSS
jgi:hypothetical protein